MPTLEQQQDWEIRLPREYSPEIQALWQKVEDSIENTISSFRLSELEKSIRAELWKFYWGGALEDIPGDSLFEKREAFCAYTLLAFLDGEKFDFWNLLRIVYFTGKREEDKVFGMEECNEDLQKLFIEVAYICAHRDGMIDGRNWTGNGDNIDEYVRDDVVYGYGLIEENPLEISSMFDTANTANGGLNTRKIDAILKDAFLDFVTSPDKSEELSFENDKDIKWYDLEYFFDENTISAEAFRDIYEGIEGGKMLWEIFWREKVELFIMRNSALDY